MRHLVFFTFLLSASGAGWPCEAAPTEKVLHSFTSSDGTDGISPTRGVVMDRSGNLYGTSPPGISTGFAPGNVYKLTPPTAGTKGWTGTAIYTFKGHLDGYWPYCDLIVDEQGKLYGTTTSGGSMNMGIVFMLAPPAPGKTKWTKTTIWSFSGPDGGGPFSGVLMDATGSLYGTTAGGGSSNDGVVYKLVPPAMGQTGWSEQVLFSFDPAAHGAVFPYAPLLADRHGGFYGTTIGGGTLDRGTVYTLMPPQAGQTAWTVRVLYSFLDGVDGYSPSNGALVRDRQGALYGMTTYGGRNLGGTVFRLSPRAGDTPPAYTLLHSFDFSFDGMGPQGGLYLDRNTNLYGTLPFRYQGYGSVFELAPPASGQTEWAETLYAFTGYDGSTPKSSLIKGRGDTLIGTAFEGGGGYGDVFAVRPAPGPAMTASDGRQAIAPSPF